MEKWFMQNFIHIYIHTLNFLKPELLKMTVGCEKRNKNTKHVCMVQVKPFKDLPQDMQWVHITY
jgi:hypothetical protein